MKPSQYILRHVTHQLEESVSDEFDGNDVKEKASPQSQETLIGENTQSKTDTRPYSPGSYDCRANF